MSYDFERDSSQRITRSAYISSVRDNFTMSAWIKCESIPGNMCIIANGYAVPTGEGYQLAVVGASSKLRWDAAYVGSVDSTDTLSTGVWYHVAAVRNSGTTTIYINGVSKGTTTSTPNALTANSKTSIGALQTTGSGWIDHFDGLIAEVAMWDTPQNSTVISALAAGAQPSLYPTNLLYYKNLINNPTGDYVDTGGSWTVTGATYNTTHPFNYVKDVLGGGLISTPRA